jgi:hypothetical protein
LLKPSVYSTASSKSPLPCVPFLHPYISSPPVSIARSIVTTLHTASHRPLRCSDWFWPPMTQPLRRLQSRPQTTADPQPRRPWPPGLPVQPSTSDGSTGKVPAPGREGVIHPAFCPPKVRRACLGLRYPTGRTCCPPHPSLVSLTSLPLRAPRHQLMLLCFFLFFSSSSLAAPPPVSGLWCGSSCSCTESASYTNCPVCLTCASSLDTSSTPLPT